MLKIENQDGLFSVTATFRKPDKLLGRFGVVKLWPDIQVAEDEVIARLANTARSLGLTCIAVDHSGRTIDPPHKLMTQDDLDFIIHLHFSTPKSYNIFSFVVLWNPLQFYYDFGYRSATRNLLTHDDFLSCSSPSADEQILRMIGDDPTREGAHFHMYHSLSEPVLVPTLGDCKLFYSGINWERLGKGLSRHQELLNELDKSGILRIYGPSIMRGIRVWEGYASYQGSLPFDGVSVMREINRAGIGLVLSSEAHKDAALMSNRLFECLAGGAVIICDENPFAKKHFGDTLLYINTTAPILNIVEQITTKLDWIKKNPDQALKLARQAQAIFSQLYRLDHALSQIYEGFCDRRAHLKSLYKPDNGTEASTMFLLLPRYDAASLKSHMLSALSVANAVCQPILVVDSFEFLHFAEEIQAAIGNASIPICQVDFHVRGPRGHIIRERRLGQVLNQLLQNEITATLVCFVAPNEQIYANHAELLAGTLARHPEADYAYSAALLAYRNNEEETIHEVFEAFDLLGQTANFPLGLARVMLRRDIAKRHAANTLVYLDLLALPGLLLHASGKPTRRATAVIDIQHPFNTGIKPGKNTSIRTIEQRMQDDQEILRDVDPEKFDKLANISSNMRTQRQSSEFLAAGTAQLMPTTFYLDKLSVQNRQVLLAQLIQSLPIPRFVWRILRVFAPWRHK